MDVYCLLNDFSNLIQSNSSLFPITVFIDVQCPHLSDVWRIQERCQCEGFVLFLLSIYHLLVNIFLSCRRQRKDSAGMKEILPANIDLQYLVFRGHSSLPALAVDLQKSCDLLQVCSNISRSLTSFVYTNLRMRRW